MQRTTPRINTPISYYGGKQAIIHHILPLIPKHDLYTENFVGGGTVYWAKDPVRNETINDKLDVVINFYRVLQKKYRQLKKLIDLTLMSRTMHKQATMIVLKKVPADDVTLAWALWFSSNFSHYCKLGGGPKYANDESTIITQTLISKKRSFLEELATRIESTYIENTPTMKMLNSRNTPTAFHYLDTPYHNADMGHYQGWTEADLKQLLNWCATECNGKFLLSNYNSEILTQFIDANGWNKKEITHRLKVPRKSGAEKIEVLVYNYPDPVKIKTLFDADTGTKTD